MSAATPGLTPAQEIGLFLRSTRESQNLSQEQLAALTSRRPGKVSRAMISAVERGLHLPGLEVLLTLSQALHISPTEVLERLELSRSAQLETRGLDLDQLDRKASDRFWSGDPRGAVHCYDAMLRLVREQQNGNGDGDRRLAVIELRRGTALRRCGSMTAARAAIEQSIVLAESYPTIQLQAYLVLVALLIQLGRLPLARDASTRALELAGTLEEPKLRGWAWIEQGEVLVASRRYDEARRAFLEARRWVREAGDVAHEIKVEGNLGTCLHRLGYLDQARHRYRSAVDLARKQRIPGSEAMWLVELGKVALEKGRARPADVFARRALEIAKNIEDNLTYFRAEWLRHRIQLTARPDDRDRHRVAFLRKLFMRLEEHRGIDEIEEFRQAYCSERRKDPS